MVTVSTPTRTPDVLRAAAVLATLAPSVHGTEPWHLVLREDSLEIHADWTRQLSALDPIGRQLVVSCGSALLNARVSLAAAGRTSTIERFPERAEPDLLARLRLSSEVGGDRSLARLDPSVQAPAAGLPALVAAAAVHEVVLRVDATPEQLLLAGRLGRISLLEQESDPACRAELRAWSHADAGPETAHQDHLLVVLGTTNDNPEDWLRTGEALQRMLLEARGAYGVRQLTHVIENPRVREELRVGLDLDVHPQLLLELGPPGSTLPSRRRRLVDVLSVAR